MEMHYAMLIADAQTYEGDDALRCHSYLPLIAVSTECFTDPLDKNLQGGGSIHLAHFVSSTRRLDEMIQMHGYLSRNAGIRYAIHNLYKYSKLLYL